MSQPVLLKIYGALSPMSPELFQNLAEISAQAMPAQDAVTLKNGMFALSFEGIWFPVEELLETLEQNAEERFHGKIDLLDLEKWQMTRYEFKEGKIGKATVPLNNVLDYSGF